MSRKKTVISCLMPIKYIVVFLWQITALEKTSVSKLTKFIVM